MRRVRWTIPAKIGTAAGALLVCVALMTLLGLRLPMPGGVNLSLARATLRVDKSQWTGWRGHAMGVRFGRAPFAEVGAVPIGAAGLFLMGVALFPRRVRINPGHCPTCEYDLRGLAAGVAVCPECGRVGSGAGLARGFSLIELLVVISIIGLLISILLPALAGAHERARRIKCLSQTQQVAECMLVYRGQNKESLPVMPVPRGLPLIESQYLYGGVSGLYSLHQVGDGVSRGYGGASPTGGAYFDGATEPLLASYLSTLDALTCPSDREDRYYGDPYSPMGNTSYAAAIPKRPVHPRKPEDVISYNVSYAYFIHGAYLCCDETNGPDLGGLAWYGYDEVPPGGSTANSTAAGAPAAGYFAPVDNHGKAGGNFAYTDGSARFLQRPVFSGDGTFIID